MCSPLSVCVDFMCARIDIPAKYDLQVQAKEFIKRTAQHPHLKLTLSEEAQEYFDSYQAMFNIRGEQLRSGHDADASAEKGISPWKIGMLSACLYMWDVLWEQDAVH